MENEAGQVGVRRPVGLGRGVPFGEQAEDELRGVDVAAEYTAHGRQPEGRAERIQAGADQALGVKGVHDPEERGLDGAGHARAHVEVPEHSVVMVAAKHARLQVHGRRRNAELFLGNPRAEAERRRHHHVPGPATFLDDPVQTLHVRQHRQLHDAPEALPRVPEPGVAHERLGLRARPQGDKPEPVLGHLRAEVLICRDRDLVAPRL